MSFGLRGPALRMIRKFHRIKQTDMGEKVGLTQPALWKIEAGRCQPKLSFLKRLSVVYGIPLYSLVWLLEVLTGEISIDEPDTERMPKQAINIARTILDGKVK